MKAIEPQFRKLYYDSKKARFYNSKLRLGGFRSGEVVLLAETEGETAGFIWLVWYEHIKHKGIAYIEEMYVRNRFRKRGIGRLLVAGALNAAKRKGCTAVFVTTGEHMKAAQRFYVKVGMRPMKAAWFVKDLQQKSKKVGLRYL